MYENGHHFINKHTGCSWFWCGWFLRLRGWFLRGCGRCGCRLGVTVVLVGAIVTVFVSIAEPRLWFALSVTSKFIVFTKSRSWILKLTSWKRIFVTGILLMSVPFEVQSASSDLSRQSKLPSQTHLFGMHPYDVAHLNLSDSQMLDSKWKNQHQITFILRWKKQIEPVVVGRLVVVSCCSMIVTCNSSVVVGVGASVATK